MPRRWGQIRAGIGERDYVGGLRATGTNAKNRSTGSVPDAASRSSSDGSTSRLGSAVRRSRCIANCLSSGGNVASHLARGAFFTAMSLRSHRLSRNCLCKMSSMMRCVAPMLAQRSFLVTLFDVRISIASTTQPDQGTMPATTRRSLRLSPTLRRASSLAVCGVPPSWSCRWRRVPSAPLRSEHSSKLLAWERGRGCSALIAW